MLKIYLLSFGFYLIAGIIILSISKLLARRWRILSWPKLFICSVCAAMISVITFYCYLEFVEHGNIGGGSGMGAVVLAVVGLVAGGVGGLIGLFLMAGMLSEKCITE